MADWGLLAEALLAAAGAKLRLWTMPFAQIAPRLGTKGAETLRGEEAAAEREVARRVSWAVQAVGRYLPERVVCLPQAMAAQRMLARRGVATTLYLGVKQDAAKAGGMGAHAWLRAGNFLVTGKAARPGHVVVGMFAQTERKRSGGGWWARAVLGWVTVVGLVGLTLAPRPPLQDLRRQAWAAEWRDWLHWAGANDFLLNLVGFALVNVMLHLAWYGLRRAAWPYRLKSAGVVLGLAWGLEAVQLGLPGRHFDGMDLLAAVVAVGLTTWPWMKGRKAGVGGVSGGGDGGGGGGDVASGGSA